MSKDQEIYKISLSGNDLKDPRRMKALYDLLDRLQEEQARHIKNIAIDMNVSEACAADIVYLRSRTRHTPELEAELIRLHQQGIPPNVFEFGCPMGG